MIGGTRNPILRIKGTIMRRSLAVLWLIALVSDVAAQEFEMPALRGSTPFVPAPPVYHNWSGFYGGGQVGAAPAGIGFGSSPGTLISDILRFTRLGSEAAPTSWPLLKPAYPKGATFGGF